MLKKKLCILFLLSVLFVSVVYTMDQQKNKEQLIELVSKEEEKFKMERKVAEHQSGLLHQTLQEHDVPRRARDERDSEIPSILVPNVPSRRLVDMRELMEEAYEYKSESQEQQKKKLAKFIEEGISKNRSELCVRQNILIDTLAGANYLNAPLILKSLAYVLSQWKVTKDMLRKYSRDLFLTIQAEYVLRFGRKPIELFEDKIIKDLKKRKLYERGVKAIKEDGKMFVPEYKKEKGLFKKEKIVLGDFVEIAEHIEGFHETFNYVVLFDNFCKVTFFNIKTGEENVFEFCPGQYVKSFLLSRCGRYITITHKMFLSDDCCSGFVKFWDIEASELLTGKIGVVYCGKLIDFSDCGRYVATWHESKHGVEIFDIKKEKSIKKISIEKDRGQEKSVRLLGMKFSFNGKYIALLTRCGTVMIFYVATGRGKKIMVDNRELDGRRMAVSHCGKYVALLNYFKMRIYNGETGKCKKEIVFDSELALSNKNVLKGIIAFSPCGRYILLGFSLGYTMGREHFCRNGIGVANLEADSTWNLKMIEFRDDDQSLSAVFSPCGKYVIFAALDRESEDLLDDSKGVVRFWNIEKSNIERELSFSKFGYVLGLRKFV